MAPDFPFPGHIEIKGCTHKIELKLNRMKDYDTHGNDRTEVYIAQGFTQCTTCTDMFCKMRTNDIYQKIKG